MQVAAITSRIQGALGRAPGRKLLVGVRLEGAAGQGCKAEGYHAAQHVPVLGRSACQAPQHSVNLREQPPDEATVSVVPPVTICQ